MQCSAEKRRAAGRGERGKREGPKTATRGKQTVVSAGRGTSEERTKCMTENAFAEERL